MKTGAVLAATVATVTALGNDGTIDLVGVPSCVANCITDADKTVDCKLNINCFCSAGSQMKIGGIEIADCIDHACSGSDKTNGVTWAGLICGTPNDIFATVAAAADTTSSAASASTTAPSAGDHTIDLTGVPACVSHCITEADKLVGCHLSQSCFCSAGSQAKIGGIEIEDCIDHACGGSDKTNGVAWADLICGTPDDIWSTVVANAATTSAASHNNTGSSDSGSNSGDNSSAMNMGGVPTPVPTPTGSNGKSGNSTSSNSGSHSGSHSGSNSGSNGKSDNGSSSNSKSGDGPDSTDSSSSSAATQSSSDGHAGAVVGPVVGPIMALLAAALAL
ncbi:hypothetical protein BGZ63DRAFT_464752 [Mariannaea sp. PMI_226]|nr:hypothetical protein BGZ63DRAFT_464752 [Mariannaea sp. PMI_226]